MEKSSITASESSGAVPTLTPVLGEQFAFRWVSAVVCGAFALGFMYFNYIPLFHSEIWRHVELGNWIINHRQLPEANPLLELAAGMDYVSTAWLSQVLMALVENQWHAEGLSNLLAVSQTLSLILLAVLFYRISGSPWVAIAGTAGVVLAWWGQAGILRPQVFGNLMLAILLVLLFLKNSAAESGRRSWMLLIMIPLLMALWTNLDGSFVVGWVIIAGITAGHAVQYFRGQLTEPLSFWTGLLLLSTICTWLNPAGVDYWRDVASWNSPLLLDGGGIRPMTLMNWHGIWFCSFWFIAILVLNRSRRPLALGPAIVIIAMTVLVAVNELLINWFAPVAIAMLMPHIADMLKQHESRTTSVRQNAGPDQPLKFAFTLACLLFVWVAFAFSPISRGILGGEPRTESQIHNRHTPLAVSTYFASHPPEGMVLAPQYWADWLVWTSTGATRVYLNSDPQAVPRQVREDYVRAVKGNEGWQKVLERYAIDFLVIDKQRQSSLIRKLYTDGKDWSIVMEDPQVMILKRKQHSIPDHNCEHDS